MGKLVTTRKYLRSSLAVLLQALTCLYTIPFSFFTRIAVSKPKNFVVPSGTLIISNHQSKSDPFLIIRFLGFANFIRNAPTRFPTIHSFMDIPILGQFLWSIYCFKVGESTMERAHALIQMRDILRLRKTILLFPEGRRIRIGNEVEIFHKGIDMLLAKDFSILLVRLRNFNDWRLFGYGKRASITFEIMPENLSTEQKRSYITDFYAS